MTRRRQGQEARGERLNEVEAVVRESESERAV